MKSRRGVIAVLSALCITIANGEDSMVRIDVRHIACPKADVNELLEKDITQALDVEDLSMLLKQGSGRIISSQSLVTETGQESVIYDADTHRIACDIRVEAIKLSSETNAPVAAVAAPQDFEDFDVGISLSATPVMSDDSKLIRMQISSHYIEDIEMRPGTIGCIHSEKGELNLIFEKPVIKRHVIESIITIQDGETLLIGGGTTTKDNEDVYVLVSCRILSGGAGAPKD